jgi:DHHC palmitoyltransferase
MTAFCCRCAGRVGNMIVLFQRNRVPYYDPITDTTLQRPELIVVLGPYWMVLLFVTIPIFALFTVYTFFHVIRHDQPKMVLVIHILTTIGLFGSLLMVGCRNPGILYRQSTLPVQRQSYSNHQIPHSTYHHRHHHPRNVDEWQWNDQAMTYRPSKAKYDAECAVVIEQFDHTCPWTGTAIGKNNIVWFRVFIIFVFVDIFMNAIILMFL